MHQNSGTSFQNSLRSSFHHKNASWIIWIFSFMDRYLKKKINIMNNVHKMLLIIIFFSWKNNNDINLVLVGWIEWNFTDLLVSCSEFCHFTDGQFNTLQEGRLWGITVTLSVKNCRTMVRYLFAHGNNKYFKNAHVTYCLYLFRTGKCSWLAVNSARLHNIEIRARAIQVSSAPLYAASTQKKWENIYTFKTYTQILLHKYYPNFCKITEQILLLLHQQVLSTFNDI